MMNKNKQNRRQFIRRVGQGLAGAAVLSRHQRLWSAIPDKRLNVLMVVADDQRSDTIAALGNQHIQTPHLDDLVKDGFTFTRARNMGSQVGAVCIAARAMIHTGRSLFRAPHNIPASCPSMGQVFRDAGYATFGCGKWHNERPSFARAFSAGGNIFFGGMNGNQYRVRINDYDPSGAYDLQNQRIAEKFSTEVYADAAVEFIEGHKKDAPFFAYCALTSPHDPRTPPAPYSTMYDPQKMPLPPNFLPEHPFDNGDMRVRDEMLAPFPRTPDDTRQQLCDYYGMITSQDAQLGRILQTLRDTGKAENTVILYTGDHGLAIGSHGLFGKQNVYEHSVGIPMIFRGPGISHGQSNAFAYGMDIFPTLCMLAAIEAPKSIEGQELNSIMSGQKQHVRDSTFHAYIARGPRGVRTQHAVNDGRWKYIRYRVGGKTTTQLFDLKDDPAETRNLSSERGSKGDIERLDKLLGNYQHDLDEPAAWINT